MKLDLDVTPVFERNYNSKAKIVVNRGGTRSSKSYSLAQLAVLFLFTGYVNPDTRLQSGTWSIVRKTLPALKASVLRDFEDILHDKQLYQHLTVNKTELTYRYNGRMVEFFSIDDQQKVRSRKRDVLNIAEANEIGFNEFRQLLWRTEYRIYIDFNPDDIEVWINREIEEKRAVDVGDVEVIKSTYRDNTFLTAERVREIESLSTTDKEYWSIFGLGEYATISGLIFPNVKYVDCVPEGARHIGMGLDFGFTNDPTAAIDIYQAGGELYLDEVLYEYALTNPQIAEILIKRGVKKDTEIVADSAEPKSIAELNILGLRVTHAPKGPDSVDAGIQILKRYPLNITHRSTNLRREQRAYKWDTDKDGKQLNKPIDAFNHGWDAVRYLALRKLKLRREAWALSA